MKFSKQDIVDIIRENSGGLSDSLRRSALEQREKYYGKSVYVRGLIEFTNICKNNCRYCGIRYGNKNVHRYRLTEAQILDCCRTGYESGFRTFVLQGGDDPGFTDDAVCDVVYKIKSEFADCAVTLSIGERRREVYKSFYDAGADRYLLRHETADSVHYGMLHPSDMSLKNRMKCLYDLKEIGFQVGAGFMVGSPYQTESNLADDIMFLQELRPHMVGIGPFIPHKDTEFKDFPHGTLNLTCIMLCITRLALPKVLLPCTTALSTIDAHGREMGLSCGANVIMPNLSPPDVRQDYLLYDNKACTGNEAAEYINSLSELVDSAGFKLDFSRGDSIEI